MSLSPPRIFRWIGCCSSAASEDREEERRRLEAKRQSLVKTRISDPSSPRPGVVVKAGSGSVEELADQVAAEIGRARGPSISEPAPLQREMRIALDPTAPLGLRGLPYHFEQMLTVADFTREEVLANAPAVLEMLRFEENRSRFGGASLTCIERPPSVRRYALEEMVSDGDPLQIYRDLVLLDSGAQGQVFRAVDQNGDPVALKKIQMKDDPMERRLFENEVSMLHSCRHPNVVGLRACHLTGSTLWIGMELMDGGKLTDLIVGGVPFTADQVGFFMLEMLKGLEYLHSTGRIHRDVKSDNVLVSYSGEVKLGDFGFCALVSDDERMRRTVVGTPYWMAPEVIRGHPYDSKADVWSLGIVGVELCDGEPPHMRLQQMRALYAIARNPAPKVRRRDVWPEQLLEFIEAMLVKRVTARPSTAELLRHPFLRSGGGERAGEPSVFLSSALARVRERKNSGVKVKP